VSHGQPAHKSDLFNAPAIRKAALISSCGTYRYRLTRYWGPGCTLPFVMLNPSAADAAIDDPTIRRCMGFARREGAGGIVVVNLYACRATCPEDLKRPHNPFGPSNADALMNVALAAVATRMPVACAWGAMGGLFGGDRGAIPLFRKMGATLVCLGRTASGMPRHPLYVRGDQPLEPFP
jgi:hypothetical protein